jgi:hypothetical protein
VEWQGNLHRNPSGTLMLLSELVRLFVHAMQMIPFEERDLPWLCNKETSYLTHGMINS